MATQKQYVRCCIMIAGAVVAAYVRGPVDRAKLEIALASIMHSNGLPVGDAAGIPPYVQDTLRKMGFEAETVEYQVGVGASHISTLE